MKTRITELFGIKYPIMLAGMNWLTEPKIVAAVSNAGGLGVLATAHLTGEETRKQIREVKELTDKPFGINQSLIRPMAKDSIDVAIEEKVPVINYSLGRPWFIDQVHEYGGKVIGTVVLERHAVRAEQLGVDVLSVTGHEAAGHGGFTTSLILIPLIASSVKVPIIAAGGFFDGRGLAAALALGADCISMGTRFATTKESVLHESWKQRILKATEQDTVYIDLGDPAANERVFRNKKAEAEMKKRFPVIGAIGGVIEMKRLLKLSWWEIIRSGLSTRKAEGGVSLVGQMQYAAHAANIEKVLFEGDETAATLPIGQDIAGIKDIPTCQELIERIVAEAEKTLAAAYGKARA